MIELLIFTACSGVALALLIVSFIVRDKGMALTSFIGLFCALVSTFKSYFEYMETLTLILEGC